MFSGLRQPVSARSRFDNVSLPDAARLAPLPDLRVLGAGDPGFDDRDVFRLRAAAPRPYPRAGDPIRVRRLRGPDAAAAVHGLLLLDRDALHRLRHRDRVPVPARGAAARPRVVRIRRVRLLRADPARRLRLHLAQGRARVGHLMAPGPNQHEPKRLRDYGLQSERLLWPTKGPSQFEEELGADEIEHALGLTTLGKAVRWAQTKSMWPDTFGLACCAIEMMSIVSSRYDIARFGMEAFRSSPRQADLLIVSGRVAHKMAAPLRQIYDQMLEPKWVIAMGVCASSGGMFNNYTILQGVDRIVPVDIYIPFCPPRPEALMEGIIRLHEAHQAGVPPAYERNGVAT